MSIRWKATATIWWVIFFDRTDNEH